ncbi:MAG: IS66 family transposase, partial [Magnetococcales bacterium]|nr:IS66 family transposase [Magnetococcales bacterium]
MNFDFSQPAPRLDSMTPEEGQRLVDTLWELLRIQTVRIDKLETQVKNLEERLNLNSQNSSRPPSSDFGNGKRQTRKKRRATNQSSPSKRSQGGQPGHKGTSRNLLPSDQVDEFIDCIPQSTCRCGGNVHVDPTKHARHQIFELPVIRPLITEFRLFSGICFQCGKPHTAKLPKEYINGMFGPRMMAWIVVLSGLYQISRRKIQRWLEDLVGVSVSLGTISKTEERVSDALHQSVREAADHVRTAPHVNLDETGHKQAGNTGWMWVSVTSIVTVFRIRMSRAAIVAKEILGEAFTGIVISDRYSAYNWVDPSRRQLCWAHLIRDFRRIAGRSGKAGHIGDNLLY